MNNSQKNAIFYANRQRRLERGEIEKKPGKTNYTLIKKKTIEILFKNKLVRVTVPASWTETEILKNLFLKKNKLYYFSTVSTPVFAGEIIE